MDICGLEIVGISRLAEYAERVIFLSFAYARIVYVYDKKPMKPTRPTKTTTNKNTNNKFLVKQILTKNY